MGPLAIGNIKYQTEFGLFQKMISATKPMQFDFRGAFETGANSMDNDVAVLIVAISARALTSSARRGGYRPLVTDMFGDQDTLNAAHAHRRLPGDLASGIDGQALITTLETLSRDRNLSASCAERNSRTGRSCFAPLQSVGGSWATTLKSSLKRKIRNSFSSLCADLGVPFPDISLLKPAKPDGWLIKRMGGAGGTHIRSASQFSNIRGDVYYQRKVSRHAGGGFFSG